MLGIVRHKTFTMSLIESNGHLVSAPDGVLPVLDRPVGVEPGIAGAVDNPASPFLSGQTPLNSGGIAFVC